MSKIVALSGTNTRALSTTNAASWTNGSYPASTGRGIAWNGSVFCTIPPSGRDTYTSADGVTWTVHTNALPTAGNWQAIAWNGSVFCALNGDYGSTVVATSADGITWTTRTGIAKERWELLVWNGAVFCAIDVSYCSCMTSPDGITWTLQTGLPALTYYGASSIAALSNGKICVVFNGYTDCLVSQNNGLTWTHSNFSSTPGKTFIASDGFLFCAVGGASWCYTSPDGINWTARSIYANYMPYNNVIWTGAVFVAVPDNYWNIAAYSSNGIAWSSISLGVNGTWNSLAADFVPTFGGMPVGDAVLNLVQTVYTPPVGDAVLNLIQTVNGWAVELTLSQKVYDVGDASLALVQAVIQSAGNAALSFTQSVISTGNASVALTQNVYSPASIVNSWAHWDICIICNGVDISANLIDSVKIEAQRSAARIADFTVLLSGTVDALSWVGKAVTIEYIQPDGPHWLRFKGVIVEPVFDSATLTLACTCTDDLQRLIDLQTKDYLKQLTGGYWSPYIYSDQNTGWDYLQDLLATVQKSVELNSNGVLQCNSLQNSIVADYFFDANEILDESLRVNLAQRSQLVNRIDITFQARFERLYHRVEQLFWDYPGGLGQFYAKSTFLPSQTQVTDAVKNSGWQLLAVTFEPVWPTGLYIISGIGGSAVPVVGESSVPGTFIWVNNYPDGITGATIMAAFRWQQTITHEFKLSVLAPASIAAYNGELQDSINASAAFDTPVTNWGATETTFDFIPAGFNQDDQQNHYHDEVSHVDLSNALNTVIAEASTRIAASHRTNSVSFDLPLMPYLELSHTLQVSDATVDAKGIVQRWVESYSFADGRAVTSIELAISSGNSGLDVTQPSFTAPTLPELAGPSAGATPYQQTNLPTHIGGQRYIPPRILATPPSPFQPPTVPEAEKAWIGYLTNYTAVLPGSVMYPNEFRVNFAAIPDDKTLNLLTTSTDIYNVSIPHNLLTVTA